MEVYELRRVGFLKGENTIIFLRRMVRKVVGHERRHWMQHYFEGKDRINVVCNGPNTKWDIAKEQDAHWFGDVFNRYWFGDQVMDFD